MRLVGLVIAVLLLALPSGADPAHSLGYSDETVTLGPGPDACAGGVLVHNHDGSFENGYAWAYGGTIPPYYGAFSEGYDLGSGTVRCGAYWVTTLPGYYQGQTTDCYVWEGGVSTTPGSVIGVVIGTVFGNVPNWPEVGQNDVDLNAAVGGEFAVGCWGNWPHQLVGYFYAADVDGPQGHPWACIAPGIGYPTGWQDPAIVWGPTSAMGCGVYFEQGTPAESETWGAVKALFRQ